MEKTNNFKAQMFFIVAFLGVNCDLLAVPAPRFGVMALKGVTWEQDGRISKMEEEKFFSWRGLCIIPQKKKHKVKWGRVSKYGTRWLTELS